MSFKLCACPCGREDEKGAQGMSENQEEKKNGWGGRRANQTGRPKKAEGVRPSCNMRAYPNEWELIKAFAAIVKKDRERAKRILETE